MTYNNCSLNSITERIIGSAIKVHRLLGPGLLESVYLTCLCYELKKAGLKVEREKIVPLIYEGVKLDQAYRLDLLVHEKIIRLLSKLRIRRFRDYFGRFSIQITGVISIRI